LWDFTKFTTLAQFGREMNRLDFEIKKSKIKVTARSNVVKNILCMPYLTNQIYNLSAVGDKD